MRKLFARTKPWQGSKLVVNPADGCAGAGFTLIITNAVDRISTANCRQLRRFAAYLFWQRNLGKLASALGKLTRQNLGRKTRQQLNFLRKTLAGGPVRFEQQTALHIPVRYVNFLRLF